jgi:hypothetical protein
MLAVLCDLDHNWRLLLLYDGLPRCTAHKPPYIELKRDLSIWSISHVYELRRAYALAEVPKQKGIIKIKGTLGLAVVVSIKGKHFPDF